MFCQSVGITSKENTVGVNSVGRGMMPDELRGLIRSAMEVGREVVEGSDREVERILQLQ